MPRTYKRKKTKKYTLQNLAEAIDKVRNGELTLYNASQQYNIPLTTLHDNVKNRITHTAGRPTAIPIAEESKLAQAIITMEKWGFGLTRLEIMQIVSEYVEKNEIKTPFKNNFPGPDWFINFRKRHRLSIKKAQAIEYSRRQMTDPFIINEYFDLLGKTLNDLNLFDSPQSIWNLDETSICLDPSRTKVVGQINKPCTRTTHGSGKENITVLAVANANGEKLAPLILFKGKFVWDQWMAEEEGHDYNFEISYAASNKGWMETDIFYNYLKRVLFPSLGNERPVLIIYDGHSTHVDVRVIDLAIRNNVTILKLPPHTSHLLQPLDIAVFKSFKSKWDAKLVEWQRKNVGKKMPKKVFSQTLADTWQQTNPNVIKSGFKAAGIYPYNRDVISSDLYDPDAFKRFLKTRVKSLKKICIDFCNTQLPTATDVIPLAQLSKSDIQTLRFVAKEPTQLPTCLQKSQPIQSQSKNIKPNKINIISNVLVKSAEPQPLAKPQTTLSCTFEELLLRKVQQDKKDCPSTKKKRVSKGAEVITVSMANNILEKKEEPNKNLKKKPQLKGRNNIHSKSMMQKQEQPGPSGIQKNKPKRKRQPSLNSETSVSDTMSVHSDSEIDYIDLYEERDNNDFNEETSGGNSQTNRERKFESVSCRNEIKLWEKTEKNVLTKSDSNLRSFKGKGVSKKSKGKKNQIGKENIQKKEEKDDDSLLEKNNEIKVCEKTEKNVLTKSDSHLRSFKGKGVGKKSKGKENQIIKENIQKEEEKYSDSLLEKDSVETEHESLEEEKNDEDIQQKKNIETGYETLQEEKYYDDLLEKKNVGTEHETQDEKCDDLLEKNNLGRKHETLEEDCAMEEFYKLGDSVLVRYYIRNRWKYYIGFIEKIIAHEVTRFSINFLKTVKTCQQVEFILPKRKDIDNVPESLVVKKIDIKKNVIKKEGTV